MTENAAMDYPVNRAFALAAFHAETNPACALERTGPGYLAQEAACLRASHPILKSYE